MYNKIEEIYKVTPNFGKRTFTIRVQNLDGKTVFKYRTIVFNEEEFICMEYNTQNDWYNFMKTDEYYLIKTYHHNF